MYIQITSRCNMKCAHCCQAATDNGQDMTWETFQAALQAAEGEGAIICIGGGEPTLHPEFERFLLHAIAVSEERAFIATNGSQTARALILAKLARHGVICAALSRDPWHSRIEPKVVQAFTKPERPRRDYGASESSDDLREIRDVSQHRGPYRQGRAARKSFQNKYDTQEGCACAGEPYVKPNGDVHQCGCIDAPKVGDVFHGYTPMLTPDELEHPAIRDSKLYPEDWSCYRYVVKVRAAIAAYDAENHADAMAEAAAS